MAPSVASYGDLLLRKHLSSNRDEHIHAWLSSYRASGEACKNPTYNHPSNTHRITPTTELATLTHIELQHTTHTSSIATHTHHSFPTPSLQAYRRTRGRRLICAGSLCQNGYAQIQIAFGHVVLQDCGGGRLHYCRGLRPLSPTSEQ